MSNTDDVVAALDDHQITDEEGDPTGEQNPAEESTAQEETTVEEATTAEKPQVAEEASTQEAETEDQDQLVADEAGKRYVPEKRFKEVYGKAKRYEREKGALEAQVKALNDQLLGKAPLPVAGKPSVISPEARKADQLETELLFQALPQFDPESKEYSEVLDQLGADTYKANPGITKLEAGKRAIKTAKKLTEKIAQVKVGARQVKTLQSDQGITNRVTSREGAKPDVDKMSAPELEAYLKETGQWL